eukprot:scaffold3118_cov64-Cylindrotheca_fusiformis.AAC.12
MMNSIEVLFDMIGKTTSLVVPGTFFIVLAHQRNALMVSFFIGAIGNGIMSKVLKKVIRQERPTTLTKNIDDDDVQIEPSDYGMPSSHAMSMGFIGAYTALQQLPLVVATTPSILLYIAISLRYRIQTQLHSIEQIGVGLILGSLNSIIWRYLSTMYVMDYVTTHFLNEQGVLPVYALLISASIGALLVVGSVERRIKRRFFPSKKEELPRQRG